MTRFLAFTATQLKNETGNVLEEALRAPVMLTNHGRARAYIVPAERFERMLALEDAALLDRAKRARRAGMIGPKASMALLQGLTDAATQPVPRRTEVAGRVSRKAPAATRRKAAVARR